MGAAQTGDDPEGGKSRPAAAATSSAPWAADRPGSTSSGSSPHLHVVEGVVGRSRILGDLSRQRVIRQVCASVDADSTPEEVRTAAQRALCQAEQEAEEYLQRHIRSRADEAEGDFVRVLLEAYPPGYVQPLGALLEALSDLSTTQLTAMTVKTADAVATLGPGHWVTLYQRAVHGVLAAVLERRTDGACVPSLPPPSWGERRG